MKFLSRFFLFTVLFFSIEACTPITGPGVVNSSISVRSKTLDKMVLSWSQAQDTNGNNETLEYQVVSSSSPDIETVSDVNKNGRTIRQWAKNYTSVEVELDGTERVLYYNVMVRDAVGTISFYSPLRVDFTDRTEPTVADKTLTVTELTAKSLRLNWKAATDNNTSDNELVYVVMTSKSDNLNDRADYYNNTYGRHTCYEKAASFTVLIEALELNATLWLNVFARDTNGNVTPYTAVQCRLLPSVTFTATADTLTYSYPLSADSIETLTLAVTGGEATGTLAASSPLWVTVVRWAAVYSGNAVGQGRYRFENLYNAAGEVSLLPLSEIDAKLLSNALTEYTNIYRSPVGSDGCCYRTASNAVVRIVSQVATETAAETGFRVTADENGDIIVHRSNDP